MLGSLPWWSWPTTTLYQPLLMCVSLQEGGEVHGFAVDLPGSLFMTVEESEEVMEHRVLLMDINSQTMFQVMPTHVAGMLSKQG